MEENNSRRDFLKKAAVTGIATAGGLGVQRSAFGGHVNEMESPRKIWIAGISQEGMVTATWEDMVNEVFQIMGKIKVYKPDIICLPEVFATSNVQKKYPLAGKVALSDKVLVQLSGFARQNNCYIIGSVYTKESSKVYNSGVVIDRKGNRVGEYRKTYITENEIANGITPGPLHPPVFQTDFGKIGIQICFDVLWDNGWAKLKEQGAEVVFWPSAYGGGQTINAKASRHRYVVASSTRKGSAKLCDISGEEITQTGFWDKNFYCAPVNLEKVFLHTWPYVSRFDEIRQKYGRKVLIKNYHEEEWSTIESLSPDLRVGQIMKEFNLKTYDQHKKDAELAQIKARTTT